jgi:NADH-quinone oxidoreductase subunit J
VQSAAFYVLAALAVASALVVIFQRKPVLSALALAFHLVTIAGLYLWLGAQFISMLQVIVYAGAIMVLILFVIMLLNLRDEGSEGPSRPIQRWLGGALTAGLALVFAAAVSSGVSRAFPAPAAGFGTAGALGRELFTRFFYPFEVLSLLLVVAMIGAVLLAKRRL